MRSGWSDVALSDTGRAQALGLKADVSAILFDLLVCSDFLRATETTQIAFQDVAVQTDVRLREMNYGDLNSLEYARFPQDENGVLTTSFRTGKAVRM